MCAKEAQETKVGMIKVIKVYGITIARVPYLPYGPGCLTHFPPNSLYSKNLLICIRQIDTVMAAM